MSAKTIRKALGTLQDDPDHAEAWADLAEALGFKGADSPLLPKEDVEMESAELASLLEAARRAHARRREDDAVARILEMEVAAANGTDHQASLESELAHVLDEDVLDDARAVASYRRLLALRPGDPLAEEAIAKSEAKAGRWSDLVARYVEEATAATDMALKSSLLMSAAEIAYRFGRPALEAAGKESNKKAKKLAALMDEIVGGLKEAIEIDPANRKAAVMLARVYEHLQRYEELSQVVEHLATEAPSKDEKIAGFERLARVYGKKLKSKERAAAAYERVLDLSPAHPAATSALVDFFTEKEHWDHLVALYEERLATVRGPNETGALLQIAMVHWKMRGKPEAAEPYFEKLRKLEPAHPTMLDFFREWAKEKGAHGRLQTVLTDAQRSLPDGTDRRVISAELAQLSEHGANAAKAIEQWRALYRQDPGNLGARDALKRLYRQTSGWNALTDLLRGDLERTPQDSAAARLPILREIAEVYREHIKSDSALVTVLSQIVALDKGDGQAARELARAYEALGRWRDLLATQTRLAELEEDPGAKAELYRVVARRWLEQFSNVQNAIDAYEKVFDLLSSDAEAKEKLKELYNKRRAYKPLYDLLEKESAGMEPGSSRRELWMEMARLAAERLDRGADATRLYKAVLEEDPAASPALDALEKQSERDRDWKTVTEVLERRAAIAADDASRLIVLQKLGAIYAERMQDHKGAMSAWHRVLDLSPGHAKALRVLRDSYLAVGDYDGLSALYAASSDWEGLVEVLSTAADKTTDADVKVALSYRAAEVYEARLHAPERAFRAYERILGIHANDVRATSALIPLYEKDEKWQRLPALYEVMLENAESTSDKLGWLDRLAKVSGENLQDKATSFDYARKAYELAPERPGGLVAFENSARVAGTWSAFVDALNLRLKQKKVKPEEKRILRAKLAEVCATELGRVDESVAVYRTLIEEDESDEVAVQTLDRILRATDRRDDLRWLLDVRVARANTAHKLDILSEWALLEEEAFGAPERAVALYRTMLEIVPTHGPALRSLARLLRASGDAPGAAEVLERDRDQREGPDRAAREVELAKLYIEPLKRYGDALAAAKRALDLFSGDKAALAVVEELLEIGETRARAAVVLEAAYEAEGNLPRQAGVLEVMIATAASKSDRIRLYGRLADVYEKLDQSDKAFDVVSRVASEFPSELEFWDRLSVLASKTHRSALFVEAIAKAVPPEGETELPEAVELDLAERAATLYEERLGEPDRARPYLERILSRQPNNERAFSRLKQILTTREQWIELEALYERAVSASDSHARRAELLTEVALIAEEITGDHPKAMQYYERILEIEPLHEQAIRALDTLYTREASWKKLASLLLLRLGAVDRGREREAIDLRLRLGTIFFTNLGDPVAAFEHLEGVLEREVGNREARELVERTLSIPELRNRAAVVLERVYDAKNEVRDLVRVLEVRLEFAKETQDQRELLARVASLKDERLQDDAGSFDTYARLIPLDPDDSHARSRALEIARRTGAHERAAEVLIAAAAAARSPQPRAEILSEVAHIYEDLLGDGARAEAVYKEVLAIDPDDGTLSLPAARALERIYGASGRNAELRSMLQIEVKLETEAAARRDLYARLGELCETVLDDAEGAISAWKARLEDDPSDGLALAALDRLYERTGSFRALVEVLRERANHEPSARRELMMRIAKTLGDKLHDVPEAILGYRAIVDEFGPDAATLAALATLYDAADRFEDLAETLEKDLELAETQERRLALLAHLGQVRQTKLANVEAAIDAYRQALALDPAHGPSRAALEDLLTNEAARREAAAILRPLYEAEGEHIRLLRVLDIEAEFADTSADKLALYAQAASVAEGPLADVGRAFAYASRGLEESTEDLEFPSWLERVERLAQRSGQYGPLVELLRKVVRDILDADQQLDVTLKIAVLARTQLGDKGLARDYYKKALELRTDDARALAALESLYEEAGDAKNLLDVLRRRVDAAETDPERQALLFKQAELSDKVLSDEKAAIEAYERIVDMSVDERALAALERLYSDTKRFDDLMGLYERQIGLDGTLPARKAALHHALGVVLEKEIKDTDRAFDQYEAALRIEPQHEGTIASLEGLMAEPDHSARAAEMLESVYLARLDWRRVMSTLDARLVASQDPDARRVLLRRLAKLHEEQEEDYKAALETMAKLLAEDVTDESTWAELERLARVANAEGRLAEVFADELEKVQADEPSTVRLSKRTGELFETKGNVDRALHFYRRAYSFAPAESGGAFEAIDRLLRETNRPAERVELYKEALEHRTDPAERLTTLHTIALLEETELHDDDRAIETYRAALDVDESDPHALEALSRLYARRGRFKDLADLTRRRAEQSALPEDEAKYRLELGRLLQTQLGEVSSGLDEYQTVIDLLPSAEVASPTLREVVQALEQLVADPDHKARVVEMLRPIYERADDWQHLIQVNRERLTLAIHSDERVAILRETAKLWEERGGDSGRAFEAVRDAFVLDPDDGDTRIELDRLAGVTRRWDELADAYEKGVEYGDNVARKELLASLAKVHDAKRDDPRRALEAYERLLRLDEGDPDPLDAVVTLATLLSDWAMLVRVLTKKADVPADDGERAALWRRIGETRRDMLEDTAGAIDAYERALDLESDHAWTIDRIIDLYEQKDDAARLVELYRRRVELSDPSDLDGRYALYMRAATRYEVGLGDRTEAIALLNEALGARPSDPDAMRRLDELYTYERLWPELLENLRLQAAGATDDGARRTLKKRIGDLLANELEDPRQALDAYREVFNGGPDDAVIRAIREIGETHEELRSEAADALEPVLRTIGRHADLADVYEMRLRAQSDPHERARTLRAIAEIVETEIKDLPRAEQALLRALGEEPEDAALHTEIQRVAAIIGQDGWEKYADALSDRAAAIFHANVTTDLYVRLGHVAEENLHDDPRAAKAYVRAAEQAGDTPQILEALDRLLSRMGDATGLADVLERRVGVERDLGAQADLYHRLATLQVKEFGEKSQGLATLRIALEKKPDHEASRASIEALLVDPLLFDEAFEVLEGVYRQLARTSDLSLLYERRIARAGTTRDRSRARLELARVLEDQAKDSTKAQRVVEQAVHEDPSDEAALDELERLAGITSGWREASDALERALRDAKDLATGTLAELWVRLAGWQRDKLDDKGGAEAAFTEALRIDPENLDVLTSLESLQRVPGRERDLVVTLRTRGKLEADSEVQRRVLREAKGIAETELKDPALAEAALRDMLLVHEADLWALEELTRLRDEAGDAAEVVKLLLTRAELLNDPEQGLALKHRAAEALDTKVADKARAIDLYEEILEQSPSDTKASTKLRGLYESEGRERDLAKLLVHLIDIADSAEQRSLLRLDLARLQEKRFQSPKDAADTLRAILEEEPGHTEAVLALSQLLETSGLDEELADLLHDQIRLAESRGDAEAELSLQIRLGEIFERRLKDTTRALATYETVLEKAPTHQRALEAVARIAEARFDWPRVAAALAKLVDTIQDKSGVPVALRLAFARAHLEDTDGIEDALKRALQLDPTNTDVRVQLRGLFERSKKWSELANLLVGDAEIVAAAHPELLPTPSASETAPGTNDSVPPRESIAPRSMSGGSLPPAVAVLPPPIAEQVKLYRRAAEIHIRERKSPADAIPILEKAASLASSDRELLLQLVDAYNASGRERESTKVLERVIASFGARRTKELSLYHHRLGQALASLGDKNMALVQYDMAFKIDPGSVTVLKDLGVLALETNDLDRAQKTFRVLLLQRLDPNVGITKGEVFYYLGEISAKQGDKAKAVQMLERAVENEPTLDRAKTKLMELKG
jgi:tetratricopeptide (TPR) repeat protein